MHAPVSATRSCRAARGPSGHTRLRWQAEHPGALWHGDVCHGPSLRIGKTTKPLRIHALLDDASRFVVALEAHHTEREVDMLGLFLATLRRHGAPDALYLDNGSTYRGDDLRLACERLGITLIHAQPYDAPARGKMERFWRTLREGCLDHLGTMTSLHDVQVRLLAFLDEHYHRAPHGGLVRQDARASVGERDHARHRRADARRRAHHARAPPRSQRQHARRARPRLAARPELPRRRLVTVAVDLTGAAAPVVEHDGRRYVLRPVDAVAAGKTRRKPPDATDADGAVRSGRRAARPRRWSAAASPPARGGLT